MEELDLGCNAEVVNGPVDEVQELGDDVKESCQLLLSVKREVQNGLVLVYALEDAE